ncbi:MAG: response regulator [Prevotella sp.]|nr:response regulator [Prevotella sp.]MCI5570099.1 response regulator [Prevotella sp.]MCI6369679.1 response regulator [Prevotella sp.]MCI6403600.1 response regulator [Prevotella sp.]MCI6447332.1 response regulator [Prevotella sp.]
MNIQLNPNIDACKTSVLIVDDIPINVTLIEKMLKPFHFVIEKANDGQTALDIVADNKPDLILLDLMMPGMNGYDVIKQLRAKEETQQLPIIVISALNSNEDVVKGYDLGANDFLTKPIIMNRLHTSVITQLNKAMEAKGMA